MKGLLIMKTVRILFLDDAPLYLPDLTKHDIQLELVNPNLFCCDVYCASPETCKAIRELTTKNEVDLIVIGNNEGSGVPKARSVADEMKEKSVVVWNSYHKGLEAPYAALGFNRFGTRSDLRRIIPAMLGMTN